MEKVAGFCVSILLIAFVGMIVFDMIRTVTRSKQEAKEVMILVGPKEYPDCQAKINLEVWDEMNDIGLWKWIAACVEAKENAK